MVLRVSDLRCIEINLLLQTSQPVPEKVGNNVAQSRALQLIILDLDLAMVLSLVFGILQTDRLMGLGGLHRNLT